MRIKDILSEGETEFSLCATQKQPAMKSIEAYMKRVQDPAYTPGKQALELEYQESEAHTKSEIPFKQKDLNDPRQ